MHASTRRHFLMAWVVAAIGGCTQANVASLPGGATGSQAENQELQAAARACVFRVGDAMRRSSDLRTRQLAMSEGIAECQRELKPMQAKVRDQQMATVPGPYGEALRTFVAIRSAEEAGNEPRAFQLAQAMDSQADAVKIDTQRDPAHAREMLQMLGAAQTRIGKSYEIRGNDAEAAVYYQKAIDTMASVGGIDVDARTRLGFLYANGRGVPRDRDRALALFGGAGGEILGKRGSRETAYAYLLAHEKLPYRIDDMTPGLLASVEDEESRRQTQMVAGAIAAGYLASPPSARSTTSTGSVPENKCSLGDYAMAPKLMGNMVAGWYLGGGCH